MDSDENKNSPGGETGTAARGQNNGPVADGNSEGQNHAISAGPAAADVAAQYTGPKPKGGRPRKDGLPPGSPEARAKDATNPRRRAARPPLAAAAHDLEPLPSLAPSPGGDSAAGDGSLAGASGSGAGGAVPWRAESLTSTVELALGAIRAGRVKKRRARLEKAALPPESISEMAKDLDWPEKAVEILNRAGAQALADGLNHFNVDAKFQKYAEIPVALAMIVAHEKAADARVTKILQAAGIVETPPGKSAPKANP